MSGRDIDLDRLLKLRVVVARFGEMDLAGWWNTKNQLGRFGASALSRGFPRTHHFAQARSVFAVARHRCKEVFDAPASATLWALPEAIEEEFDIRWEHWLDHAAEWAPFFAKVEGIQLPKVEAMQGADLIGVLRGIELVGDKDLERYKSIKRSAEGKAVPLPGMFEADDECVSLLALGFARGEPGAPNLAVPYARRADV